MVSVNFQNVKVYPTSGTTNKIQAAPFPSSIEQPKTTTPAFKAEGYKDAITVRTQLTTSDEKKKYEEISKELSSKYRKKL